MAPPDRPERSLLPPSSELQGLSDEKVKAIIALADSHGRRANAYAMVGMACGTLSFLGCLGSYVFLVSTHHDAAAGIVLGTTVLAIVGRMIQGRDR